MTLAEKIMWKVLRECSFAKFRRQVPLGMYIVDFLCIEHRLVIEIDGPIHEFQRRYDLERENVLRRKGYRILRFTNDDVCNDRMRVVSLIKQAMEESLGKSSVDS